MARVSAALAVILILASSGQVAAKKATPVEAAPPQPAWSMNIFDMSAFRYQNPDLNGCISGATVVMLNLIAMAPQADLPPPAGGSLPSTAFQWQPSISWNSQKSIMWFERKHMSMIPSDKGSDPHGWRNGLNYYGWGSMTAGMYRDATFRSFDDAARAVVRDLARTNKPVGILAWEGGHAQYVTGYTVRGDDPRVGDNFTILGVFLTDPLREDMTINAFIPYSTWKSGPFYLRFAPDMQTDSPYGDPIDGHVGNTEWHKRWVILEPTS